MKPDGSLPLAPFERMMLADDRPAYPMTYLFELVFRGEVDRSAWMRAWRAALDRHPLLTALVDPRRKNWIWPSAAPAPAIEWLDADTPLGERYGQSMDLAARPGLHAWIIQSASEARLILQLHHACADGVGLLHFCEDLLTFYAQFCSGAAEPPWELSPREAARLARRASFGVIPPPLRQQLRDTVTSLGETWRFLRTKLQRLPPAGSQRQSATTAGGRSGYDELLFEHDVLRGLKQAATAAGASVNDLLLRDLFLSLQCWSQRYDPLVAERSVRIMMPCNLRLPEDRALPAANVISYAFLTRNISNGLDPDRLLADIQQETKQIRELRLALYFAGSLAAATAIPFGLRTILSSRFCMATAYLTNVGDWANWLLPAAPRDEGRIVVGNLVWTDLSIVPPVREHTRVGISALTYAGQLKLGLKFDPWLFSSEDRRQFHDLFSDRIRATAALPAAALTR